MLFNDMITYLSKNIYIIILETLNLFFLLESESLKHQYISMDCEGQKYNSDLGSLSFVKYTNLSTNNRSADQYDGSTVR
jgi:hypothetical protein